MPDHKNRFALKEIIENIKEEDYIKARLVIDHFPELDLEEQKAILFQLAKTSNEFAITILSYLMIRHENIVTVFPTLTDTINEKAVYGKSLIAEGLLKGDLEKYYYVKLAGYFKIKEAAPALEKMLTNTKDTDVLISILSSLGKIAEKSTLQAIVPFMGVSDFDIASVAIQAVGKIGGGDSIKNIIAAFGDDERKNLLIINVLSEIDDENALKKINDELDSPHIKIRSRVHSIMAKKGEKAIPLLVSNLFSKVDDRLIFSLNILQKIGGEKASLAIRDLINIQPSNPNVRFAAFEALAELSNRKGDYILATGLEDENSNVRLTAAKAIDRNLDPILLKGVGNMVRAPGETAGKIARAIIDAQAGNLFLGLLDSESFRQYVFSYLGGDAHKDIVAYFVGLLKKEGHTAFADEILAVAQKKDNKFKGSICAIDDSKMVLHLYRSIITELGYEAKLFSNPVEAVDWLKSHQPDIVCTDLNMPEMSGIDVIRKIREKYSKEKLPIILVTTQDENQDNNSALKAGVSSIIQKPFDARMIESVLKQIYNP